MTARLGSKSGLRRLLRTIGIGIGLFLFVLWILAPLYFTFVSSIASDASIGKKPWQPIPAETTLDNYAAVFGFEGISSSAGYGSVKVNSRFPIAMLNSFAISLAVVLISIVLGLFAAYGLVWLRFRGSETTYGAVLVSRVVPGLAIAAPLFVAFRVTGLLGSAWALIISYNVFTLPLAVLLLVGYLSRLPHELVEAARVDGASHLQTLRRIVIPVALPGIIAAATMVFLESWSEFFFALVFTSQLTLPPLLAGFENLQQFSWGTLAAATVVAVIPPLAVAVFAQRYIIAGLSEGGSK